MVTWVPVPGHPRYDVSDDGQVRSRVTGTPRVLKPFADSSGHLQVRLYRPQGGHVNALVHRLVLEAFRGPCPDGIEVRHLDDNPERNVLSNLAYGTRSENQVDRVTLGNHYLANRTHCAKGHAFTAANTYIRPDRGPGDHRLCRTCRDEASRRYQAKRRLERV